MKGLSTTILIVVTAVVILVAALVLLAIFGNVIGNVVPITQARNICIQQGAATCPITHTKPPNWDNPTMNTPEGLKKCSELATCDCNLKQTIGTGGTTQEYVWICT
jgi:hypothetical protein